MHVAHPLDRTTAYDARMPRLLVLPLIALVVLVGGCGTDERPVTDLAGPRPQVQQESSPASSPKPTPTRSPKAKPTAKSHSGSGKTAPLLPLQRPAVDTHLLGPDRMPALGMEAAWTTRTDGPEGTRSVGACQKTSLASIGAVTSVRRTYVATVEGDRVASAAQVVARFADDKSAWRAHQVLRSWREDCEERLDYARKDVGPLRVVEVRAGTGENYRSNFGRTSAQRTRTAGFGIMREGRYISIVEVTTKLDEYPGHRDPARVAVRRIARTFA